MSLTNRALCVGNAAIDRTYAVIGDAHLATSNPSIATSSFGGVARNVAENLARLGVRVGLITRVGDDDDGRALLGFCTTVGMDVSASSVSREHATAQYIAVIDAHGELIVGASDARVIEDIEVDVLPDTDWTFVDSNLSAVRLARLIVACRASGRHVAIDAVSVEKVRRLPADLTGISILFLNVDEACAYLGELADLAPRELGIRVCARGAAAVVLTNGARGCLVVCGGDVSIVEAPNVIPIDVTGAGDALIAGTLYGLLCGESLVRAVGTGTRTAALTIATRGAVRATLGADLVRDGT